MELSYYTKLKDIMSFTLPKTIVILPSDLKNKVLSEYQDDFSSCPPLIYSWSELYDLIFSGQDSILREEKQFLALYNSLSIKNKKALQVESYYDFIDIAGDFFKFFNELEEELLDLDSITTKIDLVAWQKKNLKLYFNIYDDYKRYLEDKGYTDTLFAYRMANILSVEALKELFNGYENFIITDELKVSAKKKQISEVFCDLGIRVKTLFLEGVKESNEKDSPIVSFEPPKRQGELYLYHCDEKQTLLLKSLELLDTFKLTSFYDFDDSDKFYQNFFGEEKTLSKTPIFEYFLAWQELLQSYEPKSKTLQIEALFKAYYNSEFQRLFNLGAKDFEFLQRLIKDNYLEIYLSLKGLPRYTDDHLIPLENLRHIMSSAEAYLGFSTLGAWLLEVEKMSSLCLSKEEFKDDTEKLFEALTELQITEDLKLLEDKKNIFAENISEGLLRLNLKYLQAKIFQVNQGDYRLLNISDTPLADNKRGIFLNSTSSNINKTTTNFLLNESQRKKLSLKTIEGERLANRYQFFRDISVFEELHFLYTSSKTDSLSGVVEELRGALTSSQKVEVALPREELKNQSINSLKCLSPTFHLEGSNRELPLDIGELPKHINSYLGGALKNCPYKAYFGSLVKAEQFIIPQFQDVSPRIVGLITHRAFEELLDDFNKYFKSYKQPKLYTSQEIKDFLKNLDLINKFSLQIPSNLEEFYKNVFLIQLEESLLVFFKEFTTLLKNIQHPEIFIETRSTRKINSSFELSLQADLLVRGLNNNLIIDFKSGSGDKTQLELYKMVYFRAEDLVAAYFYQTKKRDLGKKQNLKLSFEEFKEEFEGIINSGIYQRKYRASTCNKCFYYDVCLPLKEEVSDEK